MATHLVKIRRQTGASLIELMIASIIGVIALGIVGSVFVTGQKLASERGKELLLVQNLSSTILQIKEDVQRAGFDGIGSISAKLSGASSSIHSQADQLAYAYRVASSGSSAFRNVVYKREASGSPSVGDALKICEKYSAAPLTIASAAASILGNACYQIFNPKQISISQLQLTTATVASDSADNKIVTITLTGHLLSDPTNTHTAVIKTIQRNWQ
ncbi:PilW family protein [Vibrio sp. TRT 21S02]|uniref:PilW family protein n=1 Tax=Vibrio sp. TRT 21S02 TaxID=3418507 RepID=UPI003CE8E114